MKSFDNYSLLRHNTFAINVKSRDYVEYDNIKDLHELLHDLAQEQKLFIGRGSNLLFEGDFDGCVVHSNINDIAVEKSDANHVWLRAGAGVHWDSFVAYCVDHGFHGAENLSLIPGEVGAAAAQNIGAYGAEASQIIEAVECVDTMDNSEDMVDVAHCDYSYRHSLFRTHPGRYAIHHVVFRLSRTFSPNLSYSALRSQFGDKNGYTAADIRRYVIQLRENKLPDPRRVGNAGSFFMNPLVGEADVLRVTGITPGIPYFPGKEEGTYKLPAAALIENCGWRGKRIGNVGVWDTQPLVLVNYGGATGAEVADLATRVAKSVSDKYGITLTPEVQYIK